MCNMILQLLYRWLNMPSEKGWKPKPPASALLRYLCCALLLCILIAVAARMHAGQQQKEGGRKVQDLIRDLSAKNNSQRRQAFEQILNRRTEVIQSLLKIAKMKKAHYEFSDERKLAVLLLGEMRALEAVDTLIREITFKPPGKMVDMRIPYPCVEALINIGAPSVRGLLERVERKPEKDILTLHAYIIQRIEGSHEIGTLRIKKALKDSVGGRREYLQALLEVYNQHQFVGD